MSVTDGLSAMDDQQFSDKRFCKCGMQAEVLNRLTGQRLDEANRQLLSVVVMLMRQKQRHTVYQWL